MKNCVGDFLEQPLKLKCDFTDYDQSSTFSPVFCYYLIFRIVDRYLASQELQNWTLRFRDSEAASEAAGLLFNRLYSNFKGLVSLEAL